METPNQIHECEGCGKVAEFAFPIGGGWAFSCRACRDEAIEAAAADPDMDAVTEDQFFPLDAPVVLGEPDYSDMDYDAAGDR